MNSLPPTSIVLVDDHALYRIGLRTTIAAMEAPLSIIGECASGIEFSHLLQQGKVPDLLILDIRLPDESGIAIARRLKQEYPQIKIIMLSSEVSSETVSELLEIDVEGYLSKLAQMSDIEKAIRCVLSGNHYYGQSVAKIMHDVYLSKTGITAGRKTFTRKKETALTPREIEIIQHLCDGLAAKEVGDKLNVSYRTIETHRNNILRKLGFNNTAELIKYAVKQGIVEWN
ncbi:MAG: response regulator transcription factor [Lentimicrobium sp.]|jgi:DNA-binding NarL/FixJ family response regulator|nr:response regulator transcription factor [Lentimicrobium sp.]MDD2527215.1 response regulator transcription factor [Lentimicrobiaceae bacterium]MDD4596611.1 response regulator transcription factor [Lentimicrobiaceae bacterium]MDY0025512.1 response regulator transcription factor [Lentimicrobium sp.]